MTQHELKEFAVNAMTNEQFLCYKMTNKYVGLACPHDPSLSFSSNHTKIAKT